MSLAKQLAGLVGDLVALIQDNPTALIDHYAGELSATDVVLHTAYVEKQAGSRDEYENVSQKRPVKTHKKNGPQNTAQLAVNFRCKMCPERMYPVRQYYRAGHLPVLVVYYAGSFYPHEMRRDQSQTQLVGSAAEDQLFSRMLTASGLKPDDLHYQQFLACHFNPEHSSSEDWNQRSQNCLTYLYETIQSQKIKLIILSGATAVLLMGEQKAQEAAKAADVFDFPMPENQSPVKAICLRSPAALLALEKKRNQAQQAQDQEAYERLKSSEVAIKKQVLTGLQAALREI